MGMRPMDPDERWCFTRLLEWEERFDAVMNMYDRMISYPFIAPGRVEQARTLYKALKEDLREEYKRLGSRPERTVAQERWYDRTIHEGYTHLHAPTNSR